MDHFCWSKFIFLGLIVAVKSSSDIFDMDMMDETTDDNEKPGFRWSMFLPRVVEKWCLQKCRANDKPFSRLIGARCQCLCPINAAPLLLCPPTGGLTSCYNFCQGLGYYHGGECLYNRNCFCFCGLDQPYNASVVYQ